MPAVFENRADQTIRNSSALQKALARQPGQSVIRVNVSDVGDVGVDLGRGFRRVLSGGNKSANLEAHGAPVRIDGLRSVEGVYQFNPNKNVWETITIFPAPLP